jgi:ribose transport system ATP-binding protein
MQTLTPIRAPLLGTETAAPDALRLRQIVKRFPGVVALDEVDLTLRAGQVHALAGENGAGKSSLIKVLCGIYRPDSGAMELAGRPYEPHSPVDAIRLGIRVVHQELQMLEHLSVAENLLFEALPRNRLGFIDRAALNRRAGELLAVVGLDDVSPSRRVAGLGMAQRQLIEIAKALSGDSRILILDEPTATLTSRETQRLFDIVRKLRAAGVSMLFVSHHLQELFDICDEVTVLRNGRHVATKMISATSPGDLVQLMVGRQLLESQPRKTPVATPSQTLRVAGLRYRGQAANASLSFTLHHGEVLGIAGLVGSGRTETVRAIFGADRLESGQIFRDGKAVSIAKPADALAHGICLVTEDRKDEGLVLDMPTRVNLTMADVKRYARAGWLQPDAEEAASRRMVAELDIRLASIEQPPRQLSGGNQQKVVLGKWLLRQPAVLILDEPTRGVDVGAKAEIHALLHRMADKGMALLVVSSDLPELLRLCDRIIVLSRGRLAGEVARADFDERRILELAYSEYLQQGDKND